MYVLVVSVSGLAYLYYLISTSKPTCFLTRSPLSTQIFASQLGSVWKTEQEDHVHFVLLCYSFIIVKKVVFVEC